LFGLIAGLALAAGAIFILEYLDDTLKSTDEMKEILHLTPLGAIARIGGIRAPVDGLIAARQPRSPVAEAYRMLRTNLHFAGFENPTGMLLVTSCMPGEGKTTTVGNLGVVLAQAGKHVVLIDADLRRPSLHQLFNLPNNVGLSSLFLGDVLSLDAIAQRSGIEGLWVITSGPLPPNPAEILESKQMKEILDSIRSNADWVIIDSPPVLAVADAQIIGARCSGALLVIDAGRSRNQAVRRGIETLQHAGVKIYGGALNRLTRQHDSYYYYNYYYDSATEGTKPPAPKKLKA
jgi:succinoglycan biosynthesis transport protein ExoP